MMTRLMTILTAMALVMTTFMVPADAKAKRAKTLSQLIDRALATVKKGDSKAFMSLMYLPHDGVRFCPNMKSVRGWKTAKDVKKATQKSKARVRNDMAECAKMGDWSKAKRLMMWGGEKEKPMPMCQKSKIITNNPIKVLYMLDKTPVEVRFSAPGRINGNYGFIRGPRCRQEHPIALKGKPFLQIGTPCPAQNIPSARPLPTVPDADPKQRNKLLTPLSKCGEKGTIAAVYSWVGAATRASFKDTVLESKQVGGLPQADHREIFVRGDYLGVKYQDCTRCKGIGGWSFIGRPDAMNANDLKTLQTLLGIPANVALMTTTAAWRKYYKK
jgi:hypothetical protein